KDRGMKALSPDEFELVANQVEAIVLDVRKQLDFSKSHIPRSIFIGLNDDFAPWVGALIKDVEQPILLVTEAGQEEEAVTRLARVGFDNVLGYLKDGIQAWISEGKQVDTVKSESAEEFVNDFNKSEIIVFDVRKDSEFGAQHVINARHTPLSRLNDHLAEFPKDKTFYIHCQGGYRS